MFNGDYFYKLGSYRCKLEQSPSKIQTSLNMLHGLESRVLLKARELEESASRIEKQKPLYRLVRPPTGNSSRLPEVPLPPGSRTCRYTLPRLFSSFFLGTTLSTSTTSIVKWLSFRSQCFHHRFATIQ